MLPPPAVAQIAQHALTQERGAIVYRMTRIFDVHAGPMHRHDELVLAVASEDGRTVKVRVIRDMTGGQPADARTIAQVENQYEHPNPADVFHRPFDPQFIGEYSYQALDSRTYAFTPLQRDGSHGSGTFSVDAVGNVLRYAYTPATLPRYAKSGSVTDQRSQVLPGVWAVTREEQEYSGRYAIFAGGATVVITCDSFSRYPDIASALAALPPVR